MGAEPLGTDPDAGEGPKRQGHHGGEASPAEPGEKVDGGILAGTSAANSDRRRAWRDGSMRCPLPIDPAAPSARDGPDEGCHEAARTVVRSRCRPPDKRGERRRDAPRSGDLAIAAGGRTDRACRTAVRRA